MHKKIKVVFLVKKDRKSYQVYTFQFKIPSPLVSTKYLIAWGSDSYSRLATIFYKGKQLPLLLVCFPVYHAHLEWGVLYKERLNIFVVVLL